jgi:hypothetical protein
MMNTLDTPQESAGHPRPPIAACLEGLVFPASRTDVLLYAASHGADAQVQTSLQRLPDRQYASVADLIMGYADSLW